MSESHTTPGQTVSKRLLRRAHDRPNVGPGPGFYARFGVGDPIAAAAPQTAVSAPGMAAPTPQVASSVQSPASPLARIVGRVENLAQSFAYSGMAALRIGPTTFGLRPSALLAQFSQGFEPTTLMRHDLVGPIPEVQPTLPVPARRRARVATAVRAPARHLDRVASREVDGEAADLTRDVMTLGEQLRGAERAQLRRALRSASSVAPTRRAAAVRSVLATARFSEAEEATSVADSGTALLTAQRSLASRVDARRSLAPMTDVARSRAIGGTSELGLRPVLASSPALTSLQAAESPAPTAAPDLPATRRSRDVVRPRSLLREEGPFRAEPAAQVAREARRQASVGRAGPPVDGSSQEAMGERGSSRPTEWVATLARRTTLASPSQMAGSVLGTAGSAPRTVESMPVQGLLEARGMRAAGARPTEPRSRALARLAAGAPSWGRISPRATSYLSGAVPTRAAGAVAGFAPHRAARVRFDSAPAWRSEVAHTPTLRAAVRGTSPDAAAPLAAPPAAYVSVDPAAEPLAAYVGVDPAVAAPSLSYLEPDAFGVHGEDRADVARAGRGDVAEPLAASVRPSLTSGLVGVPAESGIGPTAEPSLAGDRAVSRRVSGAPAVPSPASSDRAQEAPESGIQRVRSVARPTQLVRRAARRADATTARRTWRGHAALTPVGVASVATPPSTMAGVPGAAPTPTIGIVGRGLPSLASVGDSPVSWLKTPGHLVRGSDGSVTAAPPSSAVESASAVVDATRTSADPRAAGMEPLSVEQMSLLAPGLLPGHGDHAAAASPTVRAVARGVTAVRTDVRGSRLTGVAPAASARPEFARRAIAAPTRSAIRAAERTVAPSAMLATASDAAQQAAVGTTPQRPDGGVVAPQAATLEATSVPRALRDFAGVSMDARVGAKRETAVLAMQRMSDSLPWAGGAALVDVGAPFDLAGASARSPEASASPSLVSRALSRAAASPRLDAVGRAVVAPAVVPGVDAVADLAGWSSAFSDVPERSLAAPERFFAAPEQVVLQPSAVEPMGDEPSTAALARAEGRVVDARGSSEAPRLESNTALVSQSARAVARSATHVRRDTLGATMLATAPVARASAAHARAALSAISTDDAARTGATPADVTRASLRRTEVAAGLEPTPEAHSGVAARAALRGARVVRRTDDGRAMLSPTGVAHLHSLAESGDVPVNDAAVDVPRMELLTHESAEVADEVAPRAARRAARDATSAPDAALPTDSAPRAQRALPTEPVLPTEPALPTESLPRLESLAERVARRALDELPVGPAAAAKAGPASLDLQLPTASQASPRADVAEAGPAPVGLEAPATDLQPSREVTPVGRALARAAAGAPVDERVALAALPTTYLDIEGDLVETLIDPVSSATPLRRSSAAARALSRALAPQRDRLAADPTTYTRGWDLPEPVGGWDALERALAALGGSGVAAVARPEVLADTEFVSVQPTPGSEVSSPGAATPSAAASRSPTGRPAPAETSSATRASTSATARAFTSATPRASTSATAHASGRASGGPADQPGAPLYRAFGRISAIESVERSVGFAAPAAVPGVAQPAIPGAHRAAILGTASASAATAAGEAVPRAAAGPEPVYLAEAGADFGANAQPDESRAAAVTGERATPRSVTPRRGAASYASERLPEPAGSATRLAVAPVPAIRASDATPAFTLAMPVAGTVGDAAAAPDVAVTRVGATRGVGVQRRAGRFAAARTATVRASSRLYDAPVSAGASRRTLGLASGTPVQARLTATADGVVTRTETGAIAAPGVAPEVYLDPTAVQVAPEGAASNVAWAEGRQDVVSRPGQGASPVARTVQRAFASPVGVPAEVVGLPDGSFVPRATALQRLASTVAEGAGLVTLPDGRSVPWERAQTELGARADALSAGSDAFDFVPTFVGLEPTFAPTGGPGGVAPTVGPISGGAVAAGAPALGSRWGWRLGRPLVQGPAVQAPRVLGETWSYLSGTPGLAAGEVAAPSASATRPSWARRAVEGTSAPSEQGRDAGGALAVRDARTGAPGAPGPIAAGDSPAAAPTALLSGGLANALARARTAEEVVEVINARGASLGSLSGDMAAPAGRLVERISQLSANVEMLGGAPGIEGALVRRRRRRNAATSTVSPRATTVRHAQGPRGPGDAGSGKVMRLAAQLMDLIHLAENERRKDEAQRRVRMAEEGAEVPVPAAAGESSEEAMAMNLKALQREVLEAVVEELELRAQRGEDPDGGCSSWW